VLVVGRRQQELGRVSRAARDDDEVGAEACGLTVVIDDHVGHRRPRFVRFELHDVRVRQKRDVRVLQRGPHA
jgi:hypothetical protein